MHDIFHSKNLHWFVYIYVKNNFYKTYDLTVPMYAIYQHYILCSIYTAQFNSKKCFCPPSLEALASSVWKYSNLFNTFSFETFLTLSLLRANIKPPRNQSQLNNKKSQLWKFPQHINEGRFRNKIKKWKYIHWHRTFSYQQPLLIDAGKKGKTKEEGEKVEISC